MYLAQSIRNLAKAGSGIEKYNLNYTVLHIPLFSLSQAIPFDYISVQVLDMNDGLICKIHCLYSCLLQKPVYWHVIKPVHVEMSKVNFSTCVGNVSN